MSLIIKLCGTSGSGKSTAMRRIMGMLGPLEPVYVAGRKRPHRYVSPAGQVVLGHYEIDCGGCDTLGSAAEVYRAIELLEGKFTALLTEGLLWSEDVKWTTRLRDEGHCVRSLYLTTPVPTCVDRVAIRRSGSGNLRDVAADKGLDRNGKPKPTAEEKLTSRAGQIDRARLRLLREGLECRRASSEQAPKIVLEWLRLHAQRES